MQSEDMMQSGKRGLCIGGERKSIVLSCSQGESSEESLRLATLVKFIDFTLVWFCVYG